tara:strand:- start:541 stop:711 length:171 start_codon:yes stop_codon:yes gene_type:complete
MPNTYLSPCKKICKLVNNICVGCGRTKEEITDWIKMPIEEKVAIMNKLKGIENAGE